MPKVFISYSHDSDAHSQQVLELSNRLRKTGIDCEIDQYNSAPKQGWPRWTMQSIQQADYVLLICTETYRKRLELEEEKGEGLGVKWEGSLIFNILYRNETFNDKFIPIVFEAEHQTHVPDILFGYTYYNLNHSKEYNNLCSHILGNHRVDKPTLGKCRHAQTIYSNSLPTVEGELLGRTDELLLLDKAWTDPQTQVVQLIASGGTGKTKLLKHWLDVNTDTIDALIAWSFYSQGSSENKQVSASPFFSHAFEILKSDKSTFNTEEEKGEHLASLLQQRCCMLVLDGLEPLQHAGRGMRGELKDRAIRQLIRSLAGKHNNLCIITSRIAVHELSDRHAHIVSHNLQNLTPADGINLLKTWQVHGSEKELEKAANEYSCHALALHLLGNAVSTYLEGNILKRDTINELIGDYDELERHAFKVMQAYQYWLEGTAELQLLYLLGLFDYPIESEVLEVLWKEQIPSLTENVHLKPWKIAIRDLQKKHHLLSTHEGRPDLLDCHPLIREYFGKQLRLKHPNSWQQAHALLFKYYKSLPEKEQPDTLVEMQPLLNAVAHGCAAGMYQQSLHEVLWPRVKRKDEHYLTLVIGAFSDELAAISHFFTIPWKTVSIRLSDADKAWILGWAGFNLRALGRLREAIDPSKASLDIDLKLKKVNEVIMETHNLSELYLLLGEVQKAVKIGYRSVDYASELENKSYLSPTLSTLGNALHKAGNTDAALTHFQKAEQFRKDVPFIPYLYGHAGYQYCDLLLALNRMEKIQERAEFSLKVMKSEGWALEIALDQLTLGQYQFQRYYAKGKNKTKLLLQVAYWFNHSITGLRAAGSQEFLPHGLLARAVFFRHTNKTTLAYRDLQEVYDIAEPGPMKLHLADYHLEIGRLQLAEAKPAEACSSADQAEKLILETGYRRRNSELEELRLKIRQAE